MKAIIAFAIIFLLLPINALSKEICIDTDSKSQSPESKRGYVQTLESIYWDDCDGNVLLEQYCFDNKPKIKEISCEKGCNRGLCSRFSMFNVPRLRLPSILKLEQAISKIGINEKKVSGYELSALDTKSLNAALRDIDKRLLLIESGLPEQSEFPIIISSNGKFLKASYSDGKVKLIEAKAMVPELSTIASFQEGEISLSEFYSAISKSESRPITKRGRALILATSG